MFDYHMHTSFSADSEASMEEMVKSAIQKQLKEICFTEHIDYDYPDPSIVFDFSYDDYSAKIAAMQQKYGEQLSIKKGVEIGLQPHLYDKYRSYIQQHTFDFVICSLHTVENGSLHYREIFKNRTNEEAFRTYYEELYSIIQQFNDYDVLGHVDLIKRYTKEPVQNLFHEELGEIFKRVIHEGKGIELNTSGLRYKLSHNLPSPDVLKLYYDLGGKIITLGSDAHHPKDIGFHFKESLDLLESIGFEHIATFHKRQPTLHRIRDLR